MPMSLAKRRPASSAFASASTTPEGAKIFLPIAASTLPSPSQIIIPIPMVFCADNTALLTLTLNKFANGGDQEL